MLFHSEMSSTSDSSTDESDLATEYTISVRNYYACRNWKNYKVREWATTVAIEGRLYNPVSCGVSSEINVSDDYGKTWSEYSKLPYPLRLLQIVPVYTNGKTVVFLFGSRRGLKKGTETWLSDSDDDNWIWQTEIWKSEDSLKTVTLGNGKPEFGDPERILCAASDSGVLYVYVTSSSRHLRGLWTSQDSGLHWERRVKTWPSADPYTNQALKPGELDWHSGRLYSIGYKQFTHPTVLFSSDGGNTWEKDTIHCESKLILVKDVMYDRLLCFTSYACYVLTSRSVLWERVDAALLTSVPTTAFVVNGVVVLFGQCRFGSGYISVISYPEKALASRHKNLLLMVLARGGVDAALFHSCIAPFLFPY